MTSPSRPKIAVGIDGSDTSANALRWASGLAAETEGELSAVTAWNYPTPLLMPVVGAPVAPAHFLEEKARTKLAVTLDGTSIPTPVSHQWVEMGSARSVLTEASAEHDVLVLGRTGRSRLNQIWLGSTASYCVRHADCPVVVVNQATAPERVITVAVDGSPSSIEALVWAIGLGPDHEIVAVYSHDEWELDDLALDDAIRADLDASADVILERAVDAACERTGCEADRLLRQVRQGDPRTTIIDQAAPGELLVLGAQGHSGLARWVLGSLADYAVLHAPGSVAIWR